MLQLSNLRSDPSFLKVLVPDHEKNEYMEHFEKLWRVVQEIHPSIVKYHVAFEDETSTNTLVSIFMTTRAQQELLAIPAASPQYILDMQQVRSLLDEICNIIGRFYHKAIAITSATPEPLPVLLDRHFPRPAPFVENQPPSVQHAASQASQSRPPPPSTQPITSTSSLAAQIPASRAHSDYTL